MKIGISIINLYRINFVKLGHYQFFSDKINLYVEMDNMNVYKNR